MPKRQSRRSSRRRRNTTLAYEEEFTFSIPLGSSVTVTKATLSSLPPSTNFRPIWLKVYALAPFVPGTATRPGYNAPGGLQVIFMEGAAKNANSGLIALGSSPKSVTLRWPTSADWFSYDINNDTGIALIEGVCIGPAATDSSQAYIRGTARMRIRLQREIIVPACPTMLPIDPAPSTSQEEGYSERPGRETIQSPLLVKTLEASISDLSIVDHDLEAENSS